MTFSFLLPGACGRQACSCRLPAQHLPVLAGTPCLQFSMAKAGSFLPGRRKKAGRRWPAVPGTEEGTTVPLYLPLVWAATLRHGRQEPAGRQAA